MISLDLPNAPSTLFLFGLAGAGKSHVANLVGSLAGWHVFDADIKLTPEMLAARNSGTSFTDAMRDSFFEIVACSITELQKKYPKLVVSQAAYRQRNRDFLQSRVAGIELVQVDAAEDLIYERLRKDQRTVTPGYAQVIRNNFEPPPLGVKVIHNDDDDLRIVRQLEAFYGPR